MIGTFPSLYPDETFYSLCARYSERLGYPCNAQINRQLLNRPTAKVFHDFPISLETLCDRLPLGHGYCPNDFIQNHSFFPLHVPFSNSASLNRLISHMRLGNFPLTKHATILGTQVLHPFLRYCPACVVDDRTQYGETYWRRAHQVLHIEVCARHALQLVDSWVFTHSSTYIPPYATAEFVIPQDCHRKTWRLVDHSNLIYQLAEDISWLLQAAIPSSRLVEIGRLYTSLLKRRWFYKMNQKCTAHVALSKSLSFSKHLSEFCPPETAARFGFTQSGYPYQLLRLSHYTRWSHSPLEHLFTIRLMGYTVQNFFGLVGEVGFTSTPALQNGRNKVHGIKHPSKQQKNM